MKVPAALALLVCLAGSAAAETGARPSYFKLSNGLELVIVPDRRTPVVTHMIWYKVGSADEPAGKSGIAHFLEHLMFKGTKANPDGVFSQLVARVGGQENAFTSNDYTGYYQRVSRDHLPRLMALEADRMTGLILSDAVVTPERDVVLEEQNQRVANDPAAQLGEQVSAALYLNHPYGRPVIGWRPEIEKLNRQDALDFYIRFYTPANAVVVVVGDVTPEEVKALAEDTYGRITNRVDVPARTRPQEPEPVAARQVTLLDPRVGQPSLQRSYLVPAESNAKPGESEALDVLVHLLASGSVSRFYQQLVVEKKVAASVSGWYQSTALDLSRLSLAAGPASGVSLPQLEAAFDEVIKDV
ncbi:MAG: zinc protease, partial [Variibacter sp.]|nr:zinc protease [Variibacter sp.]